MTNKSQLLKSETPHPIPLPSGERGRVRGGHLKLEFGAYLGFGICDLGF
jgi:hypothetical protein